MAPALKTTCCCGNGCERPPDTMGRMEAIIYILAGKFLSRDELETLKEEMSMTILGQMIWDDAIKEGKEKGREEGEERYSRLILILNRENKTDQIIKSAADPEYRRMLYKKYGVLSEEDGNKR